MIGVLLARLGEKGVEVQYETSVKQLVRGPRGPVTGVIVEDTAGNAMKVEAKAVIIATGGYANHKEWLKRYTGVM
jgi:fumarate reductase flavoprotein subunit